MKSGHLWIPIVSGIENDLKFRQMSKALNLPPHYIVERFIWLWLYVISNNPDGDITDLEMDQLSIIMYLDDEINPQNIIDCAIKFHLLDVNNDRRLLIHEWENYGGKYLIKLENEAERLRNYRLQKAAKREEAKQASENIESDNHGVQVRTCTNEYGTSTYEDIQVRTRARREEKRREEKKEESTSTATVRACVETDDDRLKTDQNQSGAIQHEMDEDPEMEMKYSMEIARLNLRGAKYENSEIDHAFKIVADRVRLKRKTNPKFKITNMATYCKTIIDEERSKNQPVKPGESPPSALTPEERKAHRLKLEEENEAELKLLREQCKLKVEKIKRERENESVRTGGVASIKN